MSRRQKLCRRCQKNPAVVNYCTPCCQEVAHIRENQMHLTRATVCLLNSRPNVAEDEKAAMFLELFHPNMPASEKAKVRSAVRNART